MTVYVVIHIATREVVEIYATRAQSQKRVDEELRLHRRRCVGQEWEVVT